ncbi:hypothetical protein HDU93_004256, partial [Gonapodya sp. JEL0774]
EMAVYYKVPGPGEVEVWTAKDIEELVFRGIERFRGKHMLCGLRSVELSDAPPEHIPTIVLHLRNFGAFKSRRAVPTDSSPGPAPISSLYTGDLSRDRRSRYNFDDRVTRKMWDDVHITSAPPAAYNGDPMDAGENAGASIVLNTDTKAAITSLVESRFAHQSVVLLSDVRGDLLSRHQIRLSPWEVPLAEKHINELVNDNIDGLNDLTAEQIDERFKQALEKLHPPDHRVESFRRQAKKMTPEERELILRDIGTQKVITYGRNEHWRDHADVQIKKLVMQLAPHTEFDVVLVGPMANLVRIVVDCLLQGESVMIGNRFSAAALGEVSEECFKTNWNQVYERVVNAIISLWFRLDFICKKDLDECEGAVQKHSCGFLEDIMRHHLFKAMCWNVTTPDGVSHLERRDTSVYGRFPTVANQVEGVLNNEPPSTVFANIVGFEAKHGKNPKKAADFPKALCDSARS